ncbi:MAG: LysR family transcriptional regulator [Pseudomonadota bacterium]
MNLVKLRHTVAVDRSGSISAAADLVHISQSTITKSVAEVEEELGYKLFDRHARGVTTTSVGREFLDRAERIIADFDQLMNEAKAGDRIEDRVFRIGISPPAMQGFLTNAIANVVDESESIRIHVRTGPVEPTLRMLRRGDIDILFAPSQNLRPEKGLKIVDTIPFNISFFVNKRHPLAQKQKVTDKDLSEFPLIAADMISPYAKRMRRFAREAHENTEYLFHIIEYFPIISELVLKRNVIGVASEDFVNTTSFKSRFCVLPTPPKPPLQFRVAYPELTVKAKLVKRFLSEVPSSPGDKWRWRLG